LPTEAFRAQRRRWNATPALLDKTVLFARKKIIPGAPSPVCALPNRACLLAVRAGNDRVAVSARTGIPPRSRGLPPGQADGQRVPAQQEIRRPPAKRHWLTIENLNHGSGCRHPLPTDNWR
jgi:hypothetical protein